MTEPQANTDLEQQVKELEAARDSAIADLQRVAADFDKYYAIGRDFSKVTAAQFDLFCRRIGVDVPGARRAGSRHFARQCLDWSERRPHISGALGAAIADTFFRRGWAEKLRRSRTVRLTDSGRRALGSHFGATLSQA